MRIELWGDEVDSIRSFDPESQRSITQMDSVLIYPAAELTLTKEQMENGTDRIEKEGKKQEKAFREAGKPEEAQMCIRDSLCADAGKGREGGVYGVQEPGVHEGVFRI